MVAKVALRAGPGARLGLPWIGRRRTAAVGFDSLGSTTERRLLMRRDSDG